MNWPRNVNPAATPGFSSIGVVAPPSSLPPGRPNSSAIGNPVGVRAGTVGNIPPNRPAGRSKPCGTSTPDVDVPCNAVILLLPPYGHQYIPPDPWGQASRCPHHPP